MNGNNPADELSVFAGLGETLRGLRQARGMNLNELSAASGVPISTISKIENRQMNPSLVHAINLATALDANLGFLIDSVIRQSASFSVVHSARRPRLELPEMSLTLEDMHGEFEPGVLEARLGVIEPGARSGEEPMRHDGEEICHVLKGAIRYTIDGETHDLAQGDTIHFRCSDAHTWENIATGQTEVLWVFSDGLSF